MLLKKTLFVFAYRNGKVCPVYDIVSREWFKKINFRNLMRYSGKRRKAMTKKMFSWGTYDLFPFFPELSGQRSETGHFFHHAAVGCKIPDNDGNTKED